MSIVNERAALPPGPRNTEEPCRKNVHFLVGEDWFFHSHFLPMGFAAQRAGYEVSILTRTGETRAELEKLGFRVISLKFVRNSRNPLNLLSAILQVYRIIKRDRPTILHNIALSSILMGAIAARLGGHRLVVHAVTGIGYLAIERTVVSRLIRTTLWTCLRFLINRRGNYLLLENPDDANLAVRQRWTTRERITIVPGAGVDTDHFKELPFPMGVPVRIGMVARMIWQKGPGTAVQAMQILAERGIECELWLVGKPDPRNPHSVGADDIRVWDATPGISYRGHSSDVREIWAQCHIAIGPSFGGEGLPRSLIEAAACGRPIVASDVPGCREIVSSGENGLLVPPADPHALADALERLIIDPNLRAQYGRVSRKRVKLNYTNGVVIDKVANLYSRMIANQQ